MVSNTEGSQGDPRYWLRQPVSSGNSESSGGTHQPQLTATVIASIRRAPEGRIVHNDPRDEVRGF